MERDIEIFLIPNGLVTGSPQCPCVKLSIAAPSQPQTNGFVEGFIRTVKEEFFPEVRRRKLYESVDKLQADLDQWLHYYNYEWPHQGYCNLGRKPFDTLAAFSSTVKEGA